MGQEARKRCCSANLNQRKSSAKKFGARDKQKQLNTIEYVKEQSNSCHRHRRTRRPGRDDSAFFWQLEIHSGCRLALANHDCSFTRPTSALGLRARAGVTVRLGLQTGSGPARPVILVQLSHSGIQVLESGPDLVGPGPAPESLCRHRDGGLGQAQAGSFTMTARPAYGDYWQADRALEGRPQATGRWPPS